MKIDHGRIDKVLDDIRQIREKYPTLNLRNRTAAVNWSLRNEGDPLADLHLALITAQGVFENLDVNQIVKECDAKPLTLPYYAIKRAFRAILFTILWLRDVVGRYIVHINKL